jgi:hypothetical protein
VDGEQLVAEQIVAMDRAGNMTVRISQHASEAFWRVDVSRDAHGYTTTTVGDGDSFMMNLIQGAVSGEPVAWRHLAHWGQEAMGRTSRPSGRFA